MPRMRPRFSLRWMLIAFNLLAVVLYVLSIRPTAIATQFVNRVNSGDLSEFHALDTGLGMTVQDNIRGFSQGTHTIEIVGTSATLKPRTFSDFFMLRRSIEVSTEFRQEVAGAEQSVSAGFNLIANASGIRVDIAE